MNLLILKTNIASRHALEQLSPILDMHRAIEGWSVDLEDSDHILRIQSNADLTEPDVIKMLNWFGYRCEELPE